MTLTGPFPDPYCAPFVAPAQASPRSPRRVDPGGLRVVTLRTDRGGEGAAGLVSGGDGSDRTAEVPGRLPAELRAGLRVDVDAVQGVGEPPASRLEHGGRLRDTLADDGLRVHANAGQVVRRERSGRAHDVAREPDLGRAVKREPVCGDDVLE